MPERFPTSKPVIFAGTNLYSGTPNTGQSLWTQGGTNVHSVLSGSAGGHQTIWVGAGRLDSAFFHDSTLLALSGQPVTFYDSAASFSGNVSGVRVVGVLAPAGEQASTAISGAALRGGIVRPFGYAFYSGLCATGASGNAGWSASYTPVVSN
jgi:hypothetical protein